MPLFSSSKKTEIEVSNRVTEACDAILSEIGAELHDDLVQKLTVLRLLIDRLEKSSSDATEVEAIAIRMESEFERLIVSVRKISRQLLPAPMEGDTFIDRIEALCQNMQQIGTTHIHFQNDGACQNLGPTIEKHLFRIIQELINNSFKHSFAWHIWIHLNWTKEKLVLEVEDDGSGFSKIPEFAKRLKQKHNTLKMRTDIIRASLTYIQGEKGLIARIELNFLFKEKTRINTDV